MTAEVGANLIKNRSGFRWEQYSMLRSGEALSFSVTMQKPDGLCARPQRRTWVSKLVIMQSPHPLFVRHCDGLGANTSPITEPPLRLEVLAPPTV